MHSASDGVYAAMNNYNVQARLPSRRAFLRGAFALAAHQGLLAQSVGHGILRPPLAIPNINVVLADGRAASLRSLLEGKATALQLMFTECRTTCPVEGATFERVQTLLADQRQRKQLQLLSLSIDPKGEAPGALSAWMRIFHAGEGWVSAAPVSADLATVRSLFGQGRSLTDPHTTQVQMIDRKAQLVWRSSELPSAQEIETLLLKTADLTS